MSVKNIFKSTQYAHYIQNSTPNSGYILIDNALGQGRVEAYKIFDEILLLLINISSREWPTASNSINQNAIFINYCIKGRCEVCLDNGLTTCIREGEISISKSSAIKAFYYPLKEYEGIEFIFAIDRLAQTDVFFKNNFGLDIIKTLQRYTAEKLPFTVTANAEIQEMMNELWKKKNDLNLFETKLNTLRFLHVLAEKDISFRHTKRVYLSSVQTQIAKVVRKTISEDLQKKITVAKLAKIHNVSATTLKTYFKKLYGKNISEYLQEIRMNEAAKQIAQTNAPIFEIASMVGYENQSKFAAVFKEHFEVSPIEYRRLKCLSKQ